MKNKILGTLVVLMMVFTVTTTVKAVTIDDLMAQVKLLQKQVSDLRGQVKAEVLDAVSDMIAPTKTDVPSTTVPTTENTPVKITLPTKPLTVGSEGDSVKTLQNALIQKGLLAPDSNTGFFGTKTKEALTKYQVQNKVTANGKLDSQTLATLNKITPSSTTPSKSSSGGAKAGSKAPKLPGNNSWNYVGSPTFTSGTAMYLSIALDSNNIPFVAYTNELTGKANVMRYDSSSSSWVYVGGQGFTAGSFQHPTQYLTLAFDHYNIPFIAFSDGGVAGYKASVMRYDSSSSSWVYVGGQGFTSGIADYESLAFDSSNVPFLAFKEMGKPSVMKYNGLNWEYVGQSMFGDSSMIFYESMVLGSNNVPYVIFESSETGKATVMKYDGINWVNVGVPDSSSAQKVNELIAIDSSNVPYIAFRDDDSTGKIHVKKYNGSNWEDVGNPGYGVPTSLVFDLNDVLHIVFHYDISVEKYDNASMTWQLIGAPVAASGSQNGKLAFDSNNIPYIFYGDTNNTISNAPPTGPMASVKKYASVSFSISGTILNTSNNPVPSATVALNTGQSGTTDALGNYQIPGVDQNWNGTISASKTGYTVTALPPPMQLPLMSNQIQNFLATPDTYTISGKVVGPNGGIPGATISVVNNNPSLPQVASTTSNSGGNYSLTVPYSWSGIVKVGAPGYVIIDPVSGVYTYNNVISNQPNKNYTFAYEQYTISGVVTAKTNDMRVSGVKFTSNPINGSFPLPIPSVTTGEDGSYSFTVNYNWSGTITPSKIGWTFAPPTSTYNNVSSNKLQNYLGIH